MGAEELNGGSDKKKVRDEGAELLDGWEEEGRKMLGRRI